MGIFPFPSRNKQQAEIEPEPNLMTVLSDERVVAQPLLLRPASPSQKTLMIEAMIAARLEMWSKGGYIFVTRQDAADVVQTLAENNIPYDIFALSGTYEHHLLWSSITHAVDVGRVVVYVDDEALPANKRVEDFKRFLSKIIEQCRKWDDEPAPASWRFMPVFYIDINLPTITGFAHRMRQASKQFGTFVLTSKNAFDREIDQRLSLSRDADEIKSVAANSLCIYGGGWRNYPEIRNAHSLIDSDETKSPEWKLDLEKMKGQSILAFVADPNAPQIIRLIE